MPQATKEPARSGRQKARTGALPGKGGERRNAAVHDSRNEVPLVSAFIEDSGALAVDRVADAFGMSKIQLAETVGLKREALYKASRVRAAKTQARVKEMLEIVSRVSDWAGGKERAMAWYRAQPIAAFGGRTAESLVKSGKASAVRDYLDHLAIGGFA